MTEKQLLASIHAISQRTGFSKTGGDAAVLGELVISSDQFIEGTHFTWDQMSPAEVGYKGAVQALSDLAASASPPRGILCSAAWPTENSEKILAVFEGIERACHEYSVPLLGGDVSRAPSVYLDFTVLGAAEGTLEKSGGRPGDLIAVTGPLGSAAGGLYCLNHKLTYPRLLSAFRSPRAHITTACALNRSGVVTSLTDLSDSFAKGLHDLSTNSKFGAEISWADLPIDEELRNLTVKRNLSLQDFVFNGGEDYQLLMTLRPDVSEKLISDHGLSLVGRVGSTADVVFIEENERHKIKEVGWDPFVL